MSAPMTDEEFAYYEPRLAPMRPADLELLYAEARRARAAEAKWRALHEEKESHLLDLELARAEAAHYRKALEQIRDIGRFPITEGGTVSASAYAAMCRAFELVERALAMNATGGEKE